MKITCKHCKQEVEVPMYFYNTRIVTKTYLHLGSEDYQAIISGKAICPLCGTEMREIFHSSISNEDILWLATGERR